ncbi:MAG: DUF5693 family protein [Armatimonadota bacterium]|nr:DUF5693 family protein [Armatimonadota bacterium]
MSPRFRFPIWLWLVFAVSTASALWVAAQRYRDETANRAVHLIVDMPDVRLIAGVSGTTVPVVLEALKEKGVTGVAIAEETVDDWILSGKMRIEPGDPVRYVVEDPNLVVRMVEFAHSRLHPVDDPPAVLSFPGSPDIPLSAKFGDMRTFGLGFNVDDAANIRIAGLSVVARLSNQPLGDQFAIDGMLSAAKDVRAEGILFGGEQIIGRRELIDYAAAKIREGGFWIGPVEFTSQGGLPKIMKELDDRIVRVHSMVAAEIDRNEPPDIVDRYVRAVVERNVKALFLRPISLSSKNPLHSFGEYIGMIRGGLEREGYQAKPARPEMPEPRPLWAAIICGIGIAAAGGFLMWRVAGSKWGIGIALLLIALTAGISVDFGLKFLALAGALIFPTLAMLAAFDKENSPGTASKWLAAFFLISALSIIGGLHVAALLTLPSYMLRLEQFYGVKLAHFLPPVAVAIYLLFSDTDPKTLLKGTVRWVDMAVVGVIVLVVFIMLSRTGNDAPGDVSSLELKLRNILDRVLPERPRTKEFAIGHPALIIALAMAFRGQRAWLPLAAFLATVGQVSVLNTFCHLHTPIMVSVLRVGVGFALGGIAGLLALWLFNMFFNRRVAA